MVQSIAIALFLILFITWALILLHIAQRLAYLYEVLCIISKIVLGCDIKDLYVAKNNYNLKQACNTLNELLTSDIVEDINKLKIKRVKDGE